MNAPNTWRTNVYRVLTKQITFDDGIYKIETRNSLYAACEHDRTLVDAMLICTNDGHIRLSVTPAPLTVPFTVD